MAAALPIFHQAIAGKGHWPVARWLPFPLVALELARVVRTRWSRTVAVRAQQVALSRPG